MGVDLSLAGLRRLAYVAPRVGRAVGLAGVSRVVQSVVVGRPPDGLGLQLELQRRLLDLLRREWQDREEGLVSPEAMRVPWGQYLEALPFLLLDLPRVWARTRARRSDDLDPALAARYPGYYARNFHFQSEGYLGHRSARLYDLQVELLFGGVADAMRRRMVPPVVRFLRREAKDAKESTARILDVGCGTGRLLQMLGASVPGAALCGLDLSPHYLARARATLPRDVNASLVCENAEQMPFSDGWFDVVCCLYLLHEVPESVRQRVLAEIARVLRPGGLLVLGDTLQLRDAPQLALALRDFPKRFHEPYYLGYVRGDVETLLRESGFEVAGSEHAFVTKITVAHRPSKRRPASKGRGALRPSGKTARGSRR